MSPAAEDFRCPVCGGAGPEAFRKRGFAFAECRDCHSRWVIPGSGEAMRYDERYFAGGESSGGYASYLADRDLVRDNFARRLRWLLPLARGKRLLDVGAAYGFLVAAARDRGFDAIGVEPVPECAEFARRELAVEVRCGTVEEAELPLASFDVVTLFDVIEHLVDPARTLRRVHELLRPGGLLAVETGDCEALLARLCGARWYFYDPPQHVTFFSRASLTRLLLRSGFGAPEAIAHLGRAVSLRNFSYQLARALGPGPASNAARRIARSPVGRLRLSLPDRGNAFALAARRLDA